MSAASELATLTALAQALSRPASLADTLDAALATVADALGLETGWVWLLDAETGEPRLAAARALPPSLAQHPDAMRGDCYCLKTFRAGDLRGAANVNVVWCSRLAQIATESLRCHASVPLTAGARRLGMLNVASRDWRVLSEDELNLLTTAGALVSLAVERPRLEAAEERNRIAREIHDTIAQSLAALTLQLEVADARAGSAGDQRLSAAVSHSLALARSILDEARRSVLDLRAAPLEGRTLLQALEKLASETAATAAIEIRVEGEELEAEAPVAVEVGLYRIAQQALANVVRHAGAAHAVLRLVRADGFLRLQVEDDGVGFDPAQVPPDRFGLIGMSERARLLGGSLRLDSAPGGGTMLEVTVP